MIFNFIKHAKEVFFDKGNTGIKSNNVQGAIENVKRGLDNVEANTVYSDNGGSYVYVKSNGEIGAKSVPSSDEGTPIYPKEVLEAHDDVLSKLNTPESSTITTGTNIQNVNAHVQRIGKMCVLTGVILTKSAIPTNDIILTVPYKPKYGAKGGAFYCSSNSIINLNLDGIGLYSPNRSIPESTYLALNISYICE